MLRNNILLKNSLWNALSLGIPLLVSIPATAYLARVLTVPEFGLFMLAMVFIGYVTVLDAGLNRGVIREIANCKNNIVEQGKVIGSTLVVFVLISIAITLLSILQMDLLANSIRAEQAAVISLKELKGCFLLLIACVLPLLVNILYTAVLEGLEEFKDLALQKILSNMLIALLPVLFVSYKATLFYAIFGLVCARLTGTLLLLNMVRKHVKHIPLTFSAVTLKRMLHFSSWIALSNIINMMLIYLDRVLVSTISGIAKVGYYAGTAEIVSRFLTLSGSISRAAFPVLSKNMPLESRQALVKSSFFYTVLLALGICISSYFLSEWVITLLLGAQYVPHSNEVFKILIVGFFFNAIAYIPYTNLQGLGHSKTTTLINLVELPFYVLMLVYLTKHFSIVGTAWAWTIRVIIDFFLMSYYNTKMSNCTDPLS